MKTQFASAVLVLASFACGSPEEALQSPLLDAAGSIDDSPHLFSATQGAWMNRVRTNGAHFGLSTNSGYLCHSTDLSGAENSREIWVGFYQDGSVSYRRKDGADYPFSVVMDESLGMMHLVDPFQPTHRFVDLSVGQFGSDGYLRTLWQSYFDLWTDGSSEDTTILCEFRSQFGS